MKWLAWLAKRLKEESQSEFLIEKLQPSCLKNPIQKFVYHIDIIIMMLREKTKPVQSLQASRVEQWNWPILSRPTGPIVAAVALIWGVMVGVVSGWGQLQIIEASSLLAGMWGLLLITALGNVLLFTPFGAVWRVVNGALLGALIGALSAGLTGPEIERRAAPNQGIRRSAANVGIFALIGGLALGPICWLIAVASNAPVLGLGLSWRGALWNVLFLAIAFSMTCCATISPRWSRRR